MSSRDKANKQKNQNWRGRYQESRKRPREDYSKDDASWGWGPEDQRDYVNFQHPANYTWTSQNKNKYPRFDKKKQNSTSQNSHARFNSLNNLSFIPPAREPEEPTSFGPGSASERLERILATKKRIEEALASRSSERNNQDISLQDSAVENNKDKAVDNNVLIDSLEIRLTNTDLMEIGSVASSIATEGGDSDLIMNVGSCTTQKRSFDTTCPSGSIPVNKPPRVGGWSISAVNELFTAETTQTNRVRGGGQIYFQGGSERILGDVQSLSTDQTVECTTNKTTPTPAQPFSKSNCRVGQLYQSFLKSRLCGYTLKMRNKSPKSIGPNPFLDKTVLDNQSLQDDQTSIQKDQILELEMPLPIKVKVESSNINNTPEEVAAVEANEFCKEFSHLLTDANFLIPQEDLERLGLGHLSEMNKMVNERRNGALEFGNKDNFLRIRPLNSLNEVTENDIGSNQAPLCSDLTKNASSLSTSTSSLSVNSTDVNNLPGSAHPRNNPSTTHQNEAFQASGFNPHVLINQNLHDGSQNSSVCNILPLIDQKLPVESLVNKVTNELLRTTNSANPMLPLLFGDLSGNQHERQKLTPGLNTLFEASHSNQGADGTMQDISGKILKLFLIDKQIEELMGEKNKLYAELLSTRDVSSTLFNSWAQDTIQKGNVMTVISNTPTAVPELTKVFGSNKDHVPVPESLNQQPLHTPDELMDTEPMFVDPENVLTNPKTEDINFEPFTFCNVEPPTYNCSTPSNNSSDSNKPKLTVRKDLIDPRITESLMTVPPPPPEENQPAYEVSMKKEKKNKNKTDSEKEQTTDSDTTKKKKNKKKRKEMEIVNLIEDTDDETASVSNEKSPSGTKPLDSNSSGSNQVKNNQKKKLKNSIVIPNYTATSMTTFKKVVILGCKDGCLRVLTVWKGEQEIMAQLHRETITCVHAQSKFVLTGSTDTTICVYSLEDRLLAQTVQVRAPVQCFDVSESRVYVGTKTGLLVTFKVKVSKQLTDVGKKEPICMALEAVNEPMKLTDCGILAVKAAKEGARKVLIVSARGEQITVRDAGSGLLLRVFDWCDTVHCLQLYSESPLVYCGTNNTSVKVVNFITGENSRDCSLGRAVIQIVFVQSVLFAACYDGKVYIYDVDERKIITYVQAFQALILCMAVNKNKIIVASNKDQVAIIPYPVELRDHLKNK